MLVGWVVVVATQPHATREELWLKISSCVCHFSVLAHSPLQGNIAIGYSWESENTFCCKQQTTQATKVQKNTPICILTEEGKITGRPANSNTHTSVYTCTYAYQQDRGNYKTFGGEFCWKISCSAEGRFRRNGDGEWRLSLWAYLKEVYKPVCDFKWFELYLTIGPAVLRSAGLSHTVNIE